MNINKRKAKVAARHGLAGRWTEQPRPMFGSGKIHYEVGANTEALDERCWKRLKRKARYETLTGQTRHRFQHEAKEQIVKEREYLVCI